VQNVGILAGEPLDDYWAAIYRASGLEDTERTVESFVDGQTLRPYFNTHCFAADPAAGLMTTWLARFETLVADRSFQSTACREELHRIFLHQAVLSALLVQALAPEQIRLLPAEYSYPLHLQARIPASRRASTLNELACAVYEEDGDLTAVPAVGPLASWLRERTG
jgi:hypothetical protein